MIGAVEEEKAQGGIPLKNMSQSTLNCELNNLVIVIVTKKIVSLHPILRLVDFLVGVWLLVGEWCLPNTHSLRGRQL